MGKKLASLISHVKGMLPKQAALDAASLAQGGMPPMDPSMMGGGMPPGGAMPPMDPSMMGGGMPPMDPSMMAAMMGGGMPPGGAMPPMDPSMMAAMMGGGMPPGGAAPPMDPSMAAAQGAANGGGGPPPKIKVDINVELLQIKKLLAAIVDALGIRVPAQDMAVTPQDVARMAQQEQQPVA
jgi:hypothetical protein